MKKKYSKPYLICQELCPETLLCACSYRNENYNEAAMCGFDPEDMGFKIFASGWIDCDMADTTGQYCYQNGLTLIFGS